MPPPREPIASPGARKSKLRLRSLSAVIASRATATPSGAARASSCMARAADIGRLPGGERSARSRCAAVSRSLRARIRSMRAAAPSRYASPAPSSRAAARAASASFGSAKRPQSSRWFRPRLRAAGVNLDDRGPLRERCVLDVPHLLEELAAGKQNEVRVAGGGAHLGVVPEAARPHARVSGGKVHLHRQDVPVHVGPDPLGKPDQFLRRPALRHPVTREDDRAFGAEHETRGLRHPVRVRPGAAPDPRRGDRPPRGPLVHHVERQRDEHRAGRGVLRNLERAVDELRQLDDLLRLHAPLGDRGGHRDEVVPQHGLAEPIAGVLLARGHHERGAPLPGVVERSHAVPEPGADVEVRDPDPAGRLSPRVGHGHRDRLLQGEDVPDRGVVLEGVHERELGRPRVAEEVLDPLGYQGLHHDLAPRPGP